MGYVIYCNIIIHIIIIHYPAGDIITLDNDDMDILYIYYPYDGSYINANIHKGGILMGSMAHH